MSAVAFDTLKLADSLRAADFTPQQAEGAARAIAEAVQSDLAKRSDLGEVKAELKADIAGARGELVEVKAELKADIAGVRGELVEVKAELRADISDVRAEIIKLESVVTAKLSDAKVDTIKWACGLVGFQTVATLGGVYTLIHGFHA